MPSSTRRSTSASRSSTRAEIYGNGGDSERFLGEILEGRRDRVVLATKFGWGQETGDGSAANVRRAIEGSLERLRTDHVDLYYLHKPDPPTPIAETLNALDELVREGKVRAIGCSNFSAEQLAEADRVARELGTNRFTVLQNHYSLLRRDDDEDILPLCRELGVSYIPYFPLASGLLTGKYRRGDAGSRGNAAGRARDRRRALRSRRGVHCVCRRARTFAPRARDLRARLDAGRRLDHRRGDEARAGPRKRRGRVVAAVGRRARRARRALTCGAPRRDCIDVRGRGRHVVAAREGRSDRRVPRRCNAGGDRDRRRVPLRRAAAGHRRRGLGGAAGAAGAGDRPVLELLEVDAAISRLQAISGAGSQATRRERARGALRAGRPSPSSGSSSGCSSASCARVRSKASWPTRSRRRPVFLPATCAAPRCSPVTCLTWPKLRYAMAPAVSQQFRLDAAAAGHADARADGRRRRRSARSGWGARASSGSSTARASRRTAPATRFASSRGTSRTSPIACQRSSSRCARSTSPRSCWTARRSRCAPTGDPSRSR